MTKLVARMGLAIPAALLVLTVVADASRAKGTGLSGHLKDPQGDVTPSAQVPNPPDLVDASVERVDANLVITVSFAKGTLSPPAALTIYLDTDENPRTGVPTYSNEKERIGADYVIRGLQPHDPAKASLTHDTGPGQATFLGLLDVTTPAPDQRQYVVPLSRIGNDDGRLKFKVSCSFVTAFRQDPSASRMTVVLVDLMPDADRKPGVVR